MFPAMTAINNSFVMKINAQNAADTHVFTVSETEE